MKHFTLIELSQSTTAQRLGIDNTPSPPIMRNLMQLTDRVLDPAREMWGKPLVVTSGYRCEALNKLVGGVAGSQHLRGEAADIVVLGGNPMQNYQLFAMIRDSTIPYDQLIAEHYSTTRGIHTCQWVHISHSNTPRHQAIYH